MTAPFVWRRFALLCVLLMIPAGLASADQILLDPYHPGVTGDHARPDVIGNVQDFDIEKIVFGPLSQTGMTVQIWFNYAAAGYHNNTHTITEYQYGALTLGAGDLLFDVEDGGHNVYRWGVPILAHDGLLAGTFYQFHDNAILTSTDQMPHSGYIFHPDIPTRINPGAFHANIDAVSSAGSIAVQYAPLHNAIPGGPPELLATLQFSTIGTNFWEQFTTAGRASVHFASAYCANDYIDGFIDIPEPGTCLLLGFGLLAAGLWKRRRALLGR